MILEMKNIRKSFEGLEVLKDILGDEQVKGIVGERQFL